MSTKKLQIGNDFYDYPITGTVNYGEDATDWAEAATNALGEVQGPGDIPTSEALLNGASGAIAGLQFNTTYVQRVQIEGLLSRTLSDDSVLHESFVIEGIFGGSGEFIITGEYAGDDVGVNIFLTGGQGRFEAEQAVDNVLWTGTKEIKIKFNARAIIDEDRL